MAVYKRIDIVMHSHVNYHFLKRQESFSYTMNSQSLGWVQIMKSRIKVNKTLLYGFEKAYGCLKNLRRVCKKRKSQIRGKFED